MTKIRDIAYIRLRAPDLDKMEKFLVDFGMVRSDRTDTALYMRGANTATPYLHVTELGDPGFVGTGFIAESEASLAELSKTDGASDIVEVNEPGGGLRVTLDDPDGNRVQIIEWGATPDEGHG